MVQATREGRQRMASKRKSSSKTPTLEPQTEAVKAAEDDEDDDDFVIEIDYTADPEPATPVLMVETVIEPIVVVDEPEAPPVAELKEIEQSDDKEEVDVAAIEDDSIDDPVRMYLREISRVKLLKGPDEVA